MTHTQHLRNKMSVVIVMIRIDVAVSVCTEITQRLTVVAAVNGDKISACPDFNADQHEIDVYWMIQLKQTQAVIRHISAAQDHKLYKHISPY